MSEQSDEQSAERPVEKALDFKSYGGLIDALENVYVKISNGQLEPQQGKVMADSIKNAMMIIERIKKSETPDSTVDAINMMKGLMAGLNIVTAREILMSRDFKQLESMGANMIDVTPESLQILPTAEPERVVSAPVLSDEAKKARDLLTGGLISGSEISEVQRDETGRSKPRAKKRKTPIIPERVRDPSTELF